MAKMMDEAPVTDPDSLLGRVANEFLDRLAQGEQPDPEQYANQYPQIAEHIRRTFPAMEVIGKSLSGDAAADVSVALQPHKQLGDFGIVREIGRGGMGVVYEAEQVSVGRRVALKVLPFIALVDDRPLQRFRNEVRAAATLQHPNIVAVYSVGEERGVHYYAMQLIRGQTVASVIAQLRALRDDECALDGSTISQVLSAASPFADQGLERTSDAQQPGHTEQAAVDTRVKEGSTTWPRQNRHEFYRSIAALGIQAARALQHAHEQGVVHRDVKPGNLMLDTSGQLWITDFGLARIEADPGITMTGDLVGTLRYMSPEQALGKRIVVDNHADIYSLAATLYEFIALRPVFDGRDRQELLRQIALQEPSSLRRVDRNVPRELDVIIQRGLAKDPDQRYATAAELADDLQRFLNHEPIHAKPPTLPTRAVKWGQRHRALVASVVSIGAVVLIATTIVAIVLAARTAERAREAQRTNQGINDALAEVVRLRQNASSETPYLQDWVPLARAQIERAEYLASREAAAPELRQRVEQLRVEWEQEYRDLQLLAAMDQAWLAQTELAPSGRGFRLDNAVPALLKALEDYGIDVGVTDPLAVAATIQQRPESIQNEMLYALRVIDRYHASSIGFVTHDVDGCAVVTEILPGSLAERDGRLQVGDRVVGLAWGLGNPIKDVRDMSSIIEIGKLQATGAEPVVRVRVERSNPLRVETFSIRADTTRLWLRTVMRTVSQDSWCFAFVKAEALQDPSERRTALETLARDADIDGGPARAMTHLARELSKSGSVDHAATLLRRLQERHPDDFWVNQLLTLVLMETDPSEAVRYATVSVALRPKSAGVRLNLGRVLRDSGRSDEAMVQFQEAIRLAPDYAAAHSMLGLTYEDMGQFEEAITEYREALRLDPAYWESHANLGALLSELKQPGAAIAACREAVRIEPDNVEALNNLGGALAQSGQFDEAIAVFTKSLAVAPADKKNVIRYNLAYAYRERGSALSLAGKLDDAMADWRTAIEFRPDYPQAQKDLARALEGQGSYAEANDVWETFITSLRRMIEKEPENGWPYNALAWFRLTARDARFRDFNEAVEMAVRAAELAPQRAAAHNTLGIAYYRVGEFRKAVESLRQSMKLSDGGDANDWFFLAMAHAQLGDLDEARQWYERAESWTRANAANDARFREWWQEAAELLEESPPDAVTETNRDPATNQL